MQEQMDVFISILSFCEMQSLRASVIPNRLRDAFDARQEPLLAPGDIAGQVRAVQFADGDVRDTAHP
jgi:hypothetical protein